MRAEGWAWVEGRVRFPWHERHQFDRCRTVQREPSALQSAQLDAWGKRVDELEQQHEDLPEDGDEDALLAELDTIEQQRDAMLDSLQVADPVDAAIAGAVVYVERNGSVAVLRGAIRPQDRASSPSLWSTGEGGATAASSASKPARAEFTEGLQKQLTVHRTAALRESLASSPKVALRILAFQLACEVLESHRYHFERDTPVQIRLTDSALGSYDNAMEEARAVVDMTTRARQWAERLPGTTEALLAWALQADDYDIGELLAFCVASSLLAVDAKPAERPVTDAIARALDLDMADLWQATGARATLAPCPRPRSSRPCPRPAGRLPRRRCAP